MNEVLKKLGFRSQSPILVLNAPEEYNDILEGAEVEVHRDTKGKYKFIQVFVKSLTEATELAESAVKALDGDGHLWLCYPKGTSKKYKTDINRTKALDLFGAFGFEPVTQISINDDWSALRYRNVDYVKSMKRKTAATEKGRKRIEESKDE
jgi:hypothetical protein